MEQPHNPQEAAQRANLRSEIEEMHRRLEALADRFGVSAFVTTETTEKPSVEPEMDIYESEQEFLIHAALPGVSPDVIHVEATEHSLTLSAAIPLLAPPQHPEDGSPPRRHRRSRHAGQDRIHFFYSLPFPILPEAVTAAFQHGMLEIHLPKARVVPRAVSVPIHTGEAASRVRLQSVSAPTSQPASPPYDLAQVSSLMQRGQEGNPNRKMGHAYAQTAEEDHASKARSVGEQRGLGLGHFALAHRNSPVPPSGPDPENIEIPVDVEVEAASHKL